MGFVTNGAVVDSKPQDENWAMLAKSAKSVQGITDVVKATLAA